MIETTLYREHVLAEIDTLPEENLPFVLQLVHTLRESITLKPAAAKPSPRLGRGAAGCDLPGGWAFGTALMPNEPEIPAPREVRFTPEFKSSLRQHAKKYHQFQDCPTR